MSIFSYTNYHLFLDEKIKTLRDEDKSLSYRVLAKKCDVKSPSFLQDVASGKKSLTITGGKKVAQGIGLNILELEYFLLMIELESAEDGSEKNQIKKEIQKFHRKRKLINIDKLVTQYYQDWTHLVVREWVSTRSATVHHIAKDLASIMTSAEVKSSLTLLTQIGLLKCENDIFSAEASPVMATGNIDPLVIKNFAKKMIDLGKNSIDTVPWELREITSLTLSFDYKRIEEAKERIAEFKASFGAEFDGDHRSNSVFQCNIQFFPAFIKKG